MTVARSSIVWGIRWEPEKGNSTGWLLVFWLLGWKVWCWYVRKFAVGMLVGRLEGPLRQHVGPLHYWAALHTIVLVNGGVARPPNEPNGDLAHSGRDCWSAL